MDGAEAASDRDAEGTSAMKAAEPSPPDGDTEMRESEFQVCLGICCRLNLCSIIAVRTCVVLHYITQLVYVCHEFQRETVLHVQQVCC